MKSNAHDEFGFTLQAHFAPLFGAVCSAMGLSTHETAYLFLLNHAKAVLSAAVRASVMGPYQSQAALAGESLQRVIHQCIGLYGKDNGVEDAVVTVPTMDLWMGRHELLYSRIFNS
jgi:urease accessory protein